MSADERFERWLAESLRAGVPRAPSGLVESVLMETAALAQVDRTARWRLPLVAATGATAVAAVLLLAPVMFPRHPASGPSPGPSFSPLPSPAPPVSPTSSASTTTPAAPTFLSWERVDLLTPAPMGGGPRDVVSFGSSFVAVGGVFGTCCSESEVYGVVWISADGERWELLPRQPALGRATLASLATDGETLLATGAVWPESPTGPFTVGERTLFRSVDGRAWERVAGAPGISHLAASEGRFIGIWNGEGLPVAWVSDDGGRTWSDRPLPATLDDGRNATVHAVVGRGTGTVVAIGSIRADPGLAPTGTSWVSTDAGGTWTWAGEAVPDFELRMLAAVADRFFALGTPHDRMSTWVFSSKDGISWDGQEVVRHSHLDVGQASWLGGNDAGLFLITHEIDADGRLVATLRTAADGRSWSIVPPQPALDGVNLRLTALASTSEGILAVGEYSPDSDSGTRPAAWRSSR